MFDFFVICDLCVKKCETRKSMMPKKVQVFDEKTILATPTPIHSSSMSMAVQKAGQKNHSFEATNVSTSDGDSSLGILSVKNLDLSKDFDPAERLNRERVLAINSLTRCETDLTSLPSRLLRPSEVSSASSKHSYINSESTISESDLLPANSSTPRESLLTSTTNLEFARHERPLRGSMLTRLSLSVADQRCDLGAVLDQIHKTVNQDFSFCPGEQALGRLEQDEMSWKRKNELPVSEDFSLGPETKMSMGSYFLKRSETAPDFWLTSPEKKQDPVPLVELSDITEDSISISTIAKILADTDQTPTRAADFFMQSKKRASSPTVRRPTARPASRSSYMCPEKEEDAQSATFMKSPIFECPPEDGAKENVNTLNVREDLSPDFNQDKSVLSSRSGSSLSSLPNGKLPVATTKTELIWGCIKVGKSASQEFVIKNKSASRIGVKCSVTNPSFRLVKEGSDFSSSSKVILHPYESRTLVVTFAPTAVGAAVDNLYFSPINSRVNYAAKQFIRLFGYGGHGNVTVNNVVKDTAGKFLLPLGSLDGEELIKRVFSVKNNGSLPSFAHVSFVSNGMYLFTNVNVTPNALVLLPEEQKEVAVTYVLKKEDLNHIKARMNAPVIDIGKLVLNCGTEVDRGRLRKLYKKASEKALPTNPVFDKLLQAFPGEAMPHDLKLMREPMSALNEIMRLINTKEIVVTVEQDLDRTLTEQLQNETAVFHSLCENTNLDIFDNTGCPDTCNVEPSTIILTPPEKCTDMIFLNNGNKKKLYFEAISKPEGLRLNPNRGTIEPGQTVMINVAYDIVACKGKAVFKVKVLVDNECFDVDIKVYLNFNKL